MTRVYLDNAVVPGQVRIEPKHERAALRELLRMARDGELEVVTSRESWREQDRAHDPLERGALERGRKEVPVAIDDHLLLGFNHSRDHLGGFVTNPILTEIVDEQLFSVFRRAGLKPPDARHLMYAVTDGCQALVTLDRHFLNRRSELESLPRGIRILSPSELLAELSKGNHAGVSVRTVSRTR